MPQARDITRALSRVQAVLSPKHQAGKASRDIRLGLERISRIVSDVQTWDGVHVGGTNGKGSICAFLSGLFALAGVSYGRYVSPAFPHSRHGTTINGRTVNFELYQGEKGRVKHQYEKLVRGWRFATSEQPGDLSPFELETATAFRLFNKTHVKYGVVEVGMGGATDATNVMTRKVVTVISKIDLDHQEYLGNSLQDIAKVKAGIMRPGVPCIVDHTNPDQVMKVLREHASSIGASLVPTWKGESLLSTLDNDRWQLEDYQRQNLLCAAMAFRHIFPNRKINLNRLMETEPYLPGRMEWVDVSKLTGDVYRAPVLVDAAHNMLGVQALAKYVDSSMRSTDDPVTWVMGMSSSKTKPFDEMMATLIRPHDNVAFVEYSQGENEPQATPATIGRDIARSTVSTDGQVYDGESSIDAAFQWAVSKATNGPIIVTGSLYLVRDFYNLKGIHRFRQSKSRLASSSELWRLNQLQRQRLLTQSELEQLERERSYWEPSKKDTVSEDTESVPREGSKTSLQKTGLDLHETGNQSNSVTTTPSSLSGPVGTMEDEYQGVLEDAAKKEGVEVGTDSESQTNPKAGQAKLHELHHTIYRHNKQVQGYQTALVSIRTDIKELASLGESDTEGESQVLSRLQESVAFLQTQADKHRELANRYETDYFALREQLKAHARSTKRGPGLPRAYKNPFFAPTELDEPKVKKGYKNVLSEASIAERQKRRELGLEAENEEHGTDFWGRSISTDTKH